MSAPQRWRLGATIAFAVAILSLQAAPDDPARFAKVVHAQQKPAPQPPVDAGPLTPGAAVEREIGGGTTHVYQLTLTAGQFAHILLDQRGVDVLMKLHGPDGAQLAEMDGPNAMHGPERIALLAPATGTYKLDVRPYNDTSPLGRYRIVLDAREHPSAADRSTVNAIALLMEGQHLWAANNADAASKAIPKLAESLSLWKAVGDRQGQADTMWYLAQVHRIAMDRRQGLDYQYQLLQLRRDLGDARGEAVTLANLSMSHRALGEYQKALEVQTQGLRLARSIENYEELGISLHRMGQMYAKLGEHERAIAHFEEAVAVHAAQGFRDLESDVLWDLGTARYLLGQPREALPYFERALAAARTFNDGRRYRREATALAGLGRTYGALGEPNKALQHFEESLALSRKTGWRPAEATTLSDTALVHLSQGEVEKAIPIFDQALSIQRAIRDREFEASTLTNLARAERARGNVAAARRHVASALDIVDVLRASVTQEAFRAAYVGSREAPYKLYIDLLMTPTGERLTEAETIVALDASERWRARSLLEILAGSGTDLRGTADTDLTQRELRLQEQIDLTAARQSGLLGAGRKEQADAAGKELDLLLTEYRQVQADIRTKSPRYAALTQPRPLTVRDIQRDVLDRDSLLLEYSLGPERSHLWAVTGESVSGHVLPAGGEIVSLARRLHELLTARTQSVVNETAPQRAARLVKAETEYWSVAGRLSELLLGPVKNALAAKRLVIVADGALQYVPFGALPAPGSSVAVDSFRPLMLDREIVTLPSASVLHTMRGEFQGRARPAKTVAVLADPVFSGDDARLRSASRTTVKPSAAGNPADEAFDIQRSARASGVTEFERLRFSRTEADAVMALVGGDAGFRATDFAATKAIAKSDALGDYRILHFATHGLLNNQHPELSGLVMSLVDQNGRAQDGFLRLHDIYNLKLNADLVVLSACRTALGREIRGEGLLGLTRGFMYAGAPRVVASLWNVDDRATSELMKHFYTAMLKEGRPAADALRRAQIAMWNAPRWHSPFYWAAFVMQGDWR